MTDEFAELLRTAPASVEGGNLTFPQGDLHSTLSIWKARYDKATFGWMVITYDTALHDQMKRYGEWASGSIIPRHPATRPPPALPPLPATPGQRTAHRLRERFPPLSPITGQALGCLALSAVVAAPFMGGLTSHGSIGAGRT